MLSVLSYNILYGKKLDKIAQWLTSTPKKFDILCFQEFPKEKINFLLKALLPIKYSFKYGTNFIKNNKDYGQLTLINSKKIKFRGSKSIFLGTNFIEDKIFGLKGERSSLITKLRFGKNDLILANTHLIAYALNSHKREQLEKVTEEIKNFSKKSKMPVVLLGDLNYSSIIWQDGIFNLMRKMGFQNAHREKTHKLLFLKYQQLDYVFFKDCKASDVVIEKLSFSDHFPMRFKLKT
jgi:endonuclease/exonuclease/phosphatase family metal-dependent hydrolase